jgi:hypothetical protein
MVYDIGRRVIIDRRPPMNSNIGELDIFDGRLVWVDLAIAGPSSVYMYDISSQTLMQLTATDCGASNIFGDYVAYIDHTMGGLWTYQITTNQYKQITPPDSNPWMLDIDDRYVVYLDTNSYDICAYVLGTGETLRLTKMETYDTDPAINEGMALWTDARNDEADIYGYDIPRNRELPICVAPGAQRGAAKYGNRIVWQDGRDSLLPSRIFMGTMEVPAVSISIGEQYIGAMAIEGDIAKLPDFTTHLNERMRDCTDADDGVVDGFVTVPLTISTTASGVISISNLHIELYVVNTDPVDNDTDDDLLSDGDEIAYQLPPRDPDFDDDGILDGTETVIGSAWFEAENYGYLYTSTIADSEALSRLAVYSTNTKYVTIDIHNKVGPGTYDIMFRARADPKFSHNLVRVSGDTDGDGSYHEILADFYLTMDYRWYKIFGVVFTSPYNRIVFADRDGERIYYDKIAILPSAENTGMRTSPYDADTDLDGANDDAETVVGGYWYEAEKFPYHINVNVNHDSLASNGMSINRAITNPKASWTTVDVRNVAAGTYDILFRAKTDNPPGSADSKVGIRWDDCNDGTWSIPIIYGLTNEYRTYYSFEAVFSGSTNRIILYDEGYLTNCIDEIAFIPSGSNHGQVTDPLDPDTDMDGISDGDEVVTGAYWFEAENYHYSYAEDFSYCDPSASGGYSVYSIVYDHATISIQNKIAGTPAGKSYDIMFRAKTDSPGTQDGRVLLFGDFNGDGTYRDDDRYFSLTAEYGWYTAQGITFTSSTNRLMIGDYHNPTNYIDKVAVIPSHLNDGQVTDPRDPDTDIDGLPDGREVVTGARWCEAETHPYFYGSITQVAEDLDASNSQALYSTVIDHSTVCFYDELPAGAYNIMFRAKKTNAESDGVRISCDIDGDETYTDVVRDFALAYDYRWYSAAGIIFKASYDNTVHIGNKYDPTNYIDKVAFIPASTPAGKTFTDPLDADTDGDGAADGADLDPLVDLEVTVKVTEVLALDPIDSDDSYAGDFFANVFIDGEAYGTAGTIADETVGWTNADATSWDDDAHKTPDEIGERFTSSGLSDLTSDNPIEVIIVLRDDDYGHSPPDDGLCDISGDWPYVSVWYDLKTGQWTGDDALADANGHGHASDNEDGSAGTDQDDCEVWFDVWQNDVDGDAIPYWTEVNSYSSVPAINPVAHNSDSDDDYMPDWWEHKYGLDLGYKHDWDFDADEDGINNLQEYWCGRWSTTSPPPTQRQYIPRQEYTWGGNPTIKDIFVEIDWMEGHKFNRGAQAKVIIAFAEHNITLHIDDGWMGGGNEVSDVDYVDTWWNSGISGHVNFDQYYANNFSIEHRVFFRYCLFCHLGWHQTYNSGIDGCARSVLDDQFLIAGENMDSLMDQAQTFMHELGHCIGLPDVGHMRNDYISVMNYDWVASWGLIYTDAEWAAVDLDGGLP